MLQQVLAPAAGTQASGNTVHVVGAGPVGLLVAALLQSGGRHRVHLYEKRSEYTRTRMVQLAPYIVADSVESYSADMVDGDSVSAIFDPAELQEGLAFRQSMPADLMTHLRRWARGFCPLNDIERSLSELIDTRDGPGVMRTAASVTIDYMAEVAKPGDMIVDCTGARSLFRPHLMPAAEDDDANTYTLRLEYALVVTFLYGQPYECNEFCKYYKNIENPYYKFIPAVNRTYTDGHTTHVTGIVSIPDADYDRMPSRFDGQWLRSNFPDVANSMDRFIAKVQRETSGEIVGDLEIIRIPLNLYHARNTTSRALRRSGNGSPFANTPVFLAGDSAMGSPYFQSISLGFENAMFLASLVQQGLGREEMEDRYELYTYKQWLRVYMRSRLIKHNKDLFERVGDNFALLEKLHIY